VLVVTLVSVGLPNLSYSNVVVIWSGTVGLDPAPPLLSTVVESGNDESMIVVGLTKRV
jgi:hypothetical protein